MDFIVADIVPHPSGSSGDGGARTARAAFSAGSSGNRKSFPAVLHGLRGEERRVQTRDADDVRSTNKSDREPRSRKTNHTNLPVTQTERPEASPSRAPGPAERRFGEEEKRASEDAQNALEPTSQTSPASTDSQSQLSVPLLLPVSSQGPAQANGWTNVHEEGDGQLPVEDHVSKPDTESDGDFSTSPSVSTRTMDFPLTGSELIAGHALPDRPGSAPHDLSAPAPGAPVIQNRNEIQTRPVVKSESHLLVEEAGIENANPADTRPVTLESKSGSALTDAVALIRRTFLADPGTGLPDDKQVRKTDSVMREGVTIDHAASTQMNRYAPALHGDQDSGARTQWMFPQAQLSSVEEIERLSAFQDDHHSPQHDQAETKLPQAAVVDRQASSGQPTESLMVGAHGRAGSNPPPPPVSAPSMSQTQPAMPAHDQAEQSARVMTRSVVFDVAQPDLGHVNIRVAMTNDMVHTHLSADRAEVGQFLINGQDRLQAALQANGLDMGQFRVDIDRQGAGRSFQQGPSQEQGQPWNQGSQGTRWEQSPDRQDEPRSSLHGLLNLVA